MLPLRDHLPTRSFAFVNYAIIASNITVFIGERSLIGMGADPRAVLSAYGLEPARLLAHPHTEAMTVLSSMFMHDPLGWLHIAGNMLFLWIFGDNVEDALGHVRYALFYLLAGTGAAMAQVFTAPHSNAPMIGASGAIAGVLAAYAILYPRAAITILNPVPLLWLFWGLFLSFPAWLVILEFFVVNLWDAMHPTREPTGVAFAAHVGGFLAGLVLLPLLRPRRAIRPPSYDRWQRLSVHR